MNIFYLDRDPVIAAQMMCDKHVVKMILESAQMLSTAHRICGGNTYADKVGLYKLTHMNHPSCKWVRADQHNYMWVYNHMIALMKEYTYRYGKHHTTERLIEPLRQPSTWRWGLNFIEPPQCMPEHCRGNDTVLAYQTYYILEKSNFATWKRRNTPEWFDDKKRTILGLHDDARPRES